MPNKLESINKCNTMKLLLQLLNVLNNHYPPLNVMKIVLQNNSYHWKYHQYNSKSDE